MVMLYEHDVTEGELSHVDVGEDGYSEIRVRTPVTALKPQPPGEDEDGHTLWRLVSTVVSGSRILWFWERTV